MKKATKQPKDEETMMQTNFIKGQKVLITKGIYTWQIWEIFDYDRIGWWLFVIIDNCFLEHFSPYHLAEINDHEEGTK